MKSYSNRSTVTTTLIYCSPTIIQTPLCIWFNWQTDNFRTVRWAYQDPSRITSVSWPFIPSSGITILFSTVRQTQALVSLVCTSNMSKSTPLSKTNSVLNTRHCFKVLPNSKNDEVKQHNDPTINLAAQKARKIHFYVHQNINKKIHGMKKEPLNESMVPLQWYHLLSLHQKNGEVHVCMDMRKTIRAIIRERHHANCRQPRPYSQWSYSIIKISLWAGYHQLWRSLSPECRYITTFATHKGLWTYTRLNFGTNSACEIFQKIIQDQLRDIPSSLNICNNVIVYGRHGMTMMPLSMLCAKDLQLSTWRSIRRNVSSQICCDILRFFVLRERDYTRPQENRGCQKCTKT